jgi:hypothetical protein
MTDHRRASSLGSFAHVSNLNIHSGTVHH